MMGRRRRRRLLHSAGAPGPGAAACFWMLSSSSGSMMRVLLSSPGACKKRTRGEKEGRGRRKREKSVIFSCFFFRLCLCSRSRSHFFFLLSTSFDLDFRRGRQLPNSSNLHASIEEREREIEFVSWKETSSWEAMRATGGGQGEKIQRNPSPPPDVFGIASRACGSYEKINSLAAHDSALHFVFSTRLRRQSTMPETPVQRERKLTRLIALHLLCLFHQVSSFSSISHAPPTSSSSVDVSVDVDLLLLGACRLRRFSPPSLVPRAAAPAGAPARCQLHQGRRRCRR